ncbi:MAG TPA: tetratricopeptide repeat protein [Planktothrix sp.]|jgi:tetratricopeptide (TPR) repeat protein
MQDEATNSTEAQAVIGEIRLGELLLQFGLLQREELEEALGIVDQTGLALGRVLVLGQNINENTLHAAMQCQSYLRAGKVKTVVAAQAMRLVQDGQCKTFEDALGTLGVGPSNKNQTNRLGDLLVEAGLVTKPQLDNALAQSEQTGLPFGRLLVLSGVLTDSIMQATLNAQSMLLSGRVDKEQAIKSIRASSRRNVMASVPRPTERDFYQLPDRKSVLLGELIVASGTISKAQLSNAIELSVGSNKWLGQVLQEQKLVSEPVLNDALQLQELVMSNQFSPGDAAKVLFLIDRERLSLPVAVQKVRVGNLSSGGSKKVSFTELLQLLGVASKEDVDGAFEKARSNANITMQILLSAESCDKNFLHLANSCNSMIEAGRLTIEHACILFDYAKKRRINIDTALNELNWGQGDLTKAIQTAQAGEQWDGMQRQAEQALQEGRLDLAEKLWLDVVGLADRMNGKEHPKFVCSTERLADVYSKKGLFAQAEALYSEALMTKTRVLPPHSLHTASSVNNMAKVSYFQGKYDEAERFALRFLELYKANFPDDHPDVACALQNVATLYHMQTKYQKAEPYYVQALHICRKSLGESHPTTVRMSQNYARVLQSLKKFKEAEKVDANEAERMGTVTGSWKAVTVPAEHMLYSLSDKLTEE